MIKDAVDASLAHLQSSVAWAQAAPTPLPAVAARLAASAWLRADSTGLGYATEATGCLTKLAFTRLGAPRVVVCHDPANAASEGVPRRLGFSCFGTVADAVLPGRQAADGSVRPATKVWVLDASPAALVGQTPRTPWS